MKGSRVEHSRVEGPRFQEGLGFEVCRFGRI